MRHYDDEVEMRGTVKWYNAQKGFGFIRADNMGEPDAFLHARILHLAGVDDVEPGQAVEFEVEAGRNGPRAVRVSLVSRAGDPSFVNGASLPRRSSF
jgi:CspA family cold shock protein